MENEPMQQIWKLLEAGREKVEAHPFFGWLRSDRVPLTSRFIFSPVMIDFIMSFADLNKWFLRYESPKSAFEKSINQHTDEDATHSRLFVQNWASLKLGDTLEWSACKGLWWLFHARQGHAVRHFGMEILKLAVRCPDPLVRFAMMEAIEICGDVFFECTAPIAQQLELQQFGRHIYYGQYHRDRETGHLQSDEGCFSDATLTPEQRIQAGIAIGIVYDHFLRVLDQLREFSQSAVADYRGLQRTIELEFRRELLPPEESRNPAPSFPSNVRSTAWNFEHERLFRKIESRSQELRRHTFFDWLTNGAGASAERLQAFTPLWGIDVVGYRDFNELVLRYPNPQSPSECAINCLTENLAARGSLYLQDWAALRLDQTLNWRMIDVISYYFLSADTEIHRCNMAKVKKYAMASDSPVVRWWLMFSLERANETLFRATREVALRAEDELGITLNFWAYRHGLVESRAGITIDQTIGEMSMSADEANMVERIIDTVFDNFAEQLELSRQVALSGVFCVQTPSVPPPRVSEIVLRTPPDYVANESSAIRMVVP
jgi:hypothetical protein